MRETVIHVEDFWMRFGDVAVIKGLSFDVYQGEIFGFLGSNGSGKTTTIRALLGIYQPSGGTLSVYGKQFDPGVSAVLGYLPEERGLYKKEKVIDTMAYFGQLKGMTISAARAWSFDYLKRVELLDKANTRLDKLSGGQQQKVQLGVTIMNDPQLLILDEPTKGFDPVNRRLLLSIIEERRQAGATIVMITHQMDEVERLCDRVLLLKDGVARAYGKVSDVQDEFGGTTIKAEISGSLPASQLYRVIFADDAGNVELKPNNAQPEEIIAELVRSGVQVHSFLPSRRSLDSIFVEVYGEAAQGE
ncbi:MAG: ATP-binding cassette domain-containing protein [Propionibacteriaceae bacterium]|jgi:ABC-2 type transport system ATP-binding protein|nr:ATP-binding cassette domain-containing protein [Propionibacteriaceae bacterium]